MIVLSRAGLLVSALVLTLSACNGVNFSGSGNHEDTGQPNPAPPPDKPNPPGPLDKPTTPVTPICTAGQQAIGANVVFLIDNSNSNGETDCPGVTTIGGDSVNPVYQCGAATHRETAVLSAFDMLADVSTKDTSAGAVSQVAVVEFPTDVVNSLGSAVTTRGFVATRPLPDSRQTLEKSLLFTRHPGGGTPYGVAVDAAARIFSSAPKDEHARVAILVTDGEPTDRDPISVAENAAKLRGMGVEVITIFVTANSVRTQRQAEHENLMRQLDDQEAPGHYFNTTHYVNFESYIDDILGLNSHVSLAENITSPTTATCVDKPGQTCQRFIVEVNDSAALTAAVQQIVRQRAVQCR